MGISLTWLCKPCPECENTNHPKINTTMNSLTYRGGDIVNSTIDKVELECTECGFKVYDKSVRKAIARWNKLSDENFEKNHIVKKICKYCGKEFDYEICTQENFLENGNEYFFKTICCDGYQSKITTDKDKLKKEIAKRYNEVIIQKGIENDA